MSNRIVCGIATLGLMVLTAVPALAQAETAPESATGAGLIQFLKDAGLIGWIIIGLSVVVVGLWIEYMVTLKRARLMPEDILAELNETVEKGDRDEAARLCEESPGFFTNMVAAGLAHLNLGAVQAGQAMQDVRDEESVKLFSRIGWLKLISDVAPMLGLLGTVWGMMQAVGEYTAGRYTAQTFATAGIRLALITTLLGLVVAIVATSVYFFFRTRVTHLSLEVGEEAEKMVLTIAQRSSG